VPDGPCGCSTGAMSPEPLRRHARFSVVDLDASPALGATLAPLLDGAREVEYFSLDGRSYRRKEADGIITLRVSHDQVDFAVVYNDFKLKGGSFGKRNSERLAAFIDEMSEQQLPMLFLVDSMGARLMDGRAVVKPAFSVIPKLLRFRERQLLITCDVGHALGLGAVFFAAGHYRMAIAGKSLTNLAGPEIMRMFFGGAQDFAALAAPESQLPGNPLVNDIAPSRREMLGKARALVDMATGRGSAPTVSARRPVFPVLDLSRKPEEKLAGILEALSDTATELFACLSPSVRVYVATRHGRRFGVFINPPGNPDNLITAQTLDKYILGLDLFRIMQLPVVSFLDTPGADPRDNSGVILKLWQATQRIIDYPHGKMGVCVGRGYGGAIVLGFPRFYGATATYVLEGATVGLMHPQLIDSLLATAKSLAADWNTVKSTQTADCADLVATGVIDAVLAPRDVVPALDRFLRGA
jgi:acetyl-CoA carboxylase carboxyltransferase component